MAISLLGVLINCFVTLVITPRITNVLGIEAYGFVNLARSFVSYASIVLIAVNSFAARYITSAFLKNDDLQFKEYYSTVFWSNIIISGFFSLLALFVIVFLERIINIPEGMERDVKLLFTFVFMNFLLTTLTSVFSITGYVKDRLYQVKLITCISYIVDAGIIIVLFFVLKPQLWYMGLASLIVGMVLFSGSFVLTKKYLPEAYFRTDCLSFKAFKSLVGSGIWASLNSIGNMLNSGLDLIVSNLMLSPTGMGQIAVAKTFTAFSTMITSSIASAFHPAFLKSYQLDDKSELTDSLKYSASVCCIPVSVLYAGFFAIGSHFLKLWVPNENTELLYILVLIALMPCVFEGTLYPLYYTYTLTLNNRIPCLVTILGGFLNVGGMYFLLKYTSLGVYAILITTAVIMGIINYLFNPIYMSKCLKIKTFSFYPTIIRSIIALIATMGIFKAVSVVLPPISSWTAFIMSACLLALIGVLVQGIMMIGPRKIMTVFSRIIKRQ